MINILIPMILILGIILIKKIPYIGGNVQVALLLGGFSALLLGGVNNPLEWGVAWISGIDQIVWILFLITLGSIYAEAQTKLGAMETVLNSLRSLLGHTAKGLVVAIFISLVIGGSLIGSAIATSAVLGILIIKPLADLGISPVKISAIIVMGASLGSILPPISQATFLSASLLGIEPGNVVQPTYITIIMGVIFCLLVTLYVYLRKDNIALSKELIPQEPFSQIVLSRWKTLVPLTFLVSLVVVDSIPSVDIMAGIFNHISINNEPFLVWLSEVPILKGFSNSIVLYLFFSMLVTFFYGSTRRDFKKILTGSMKNVKTPITILICAGFMIGSFNFGGQIDVLTNFASGLENDNLLKWAGAAALALMGMMTGSQSTAQTTVFTFFGPSLEAIGVDTVDAAIAGAHIAASGQGLPPADGITFVVAGLVAGMLGKEVDPIKSMFYSSIMCVYLFAVGMFFLYF